MDERIVGALTWGDVAFFGVIIAGFCFVCFAVHRWGDPD